MDKCDAAGGIFVFTPEKSHPLLGLQLRTDTSEWAGTGGIIEDYDDEGGGIANTILNCIRRECVEELGTWYEDDIIYEDDWMPYHHKQRMDSHDGYYYTRFIRMQDPYYGTFIEEFNFTPSEVSDFDFRTLDEWIQEPKLHSKVREHFERRV